MFVAGALLWANATERKRTTYYSGLLGHMTSEQVELWRNSKSFAYQEDTWVENGWPWVFRAYLTTKSHGTSDWLGYPWSRVIEGLGLDVPTWDFKFLALDALVALAVLTAVAVACEVWIRRRARRKAERPAALS
jgi:hypothetical protein